MLDGESTSADKAGAACFVEFAVVGTSPSTQVASTPCAFAVASEA